MKKPVPAPLPVVVLLAASVLWGVTWWPLKQFNQQGIAGPALILFAYGAVALALLPVLWRERAAWRGRTSLLLLILLLGGFANLAFASAMVYGNVVRAMVLFYLTPVWGVLGGRIFLGESIDAKRGLGVAGALTGAFLILGGTVIFESPPSAVDLLATASGLTFALNNIVFRATQSQPLGSKVAAMFLGCFVMAGGFMLLQQQPLPSLSSATGGWLAAFGLGWLLVATAGTQWAVTHMEAGRASILIILELVVAVLTATWIGGESVSAQELAGGLLILAAAVMEARRAGETPLPPALPARD